MKALTLGRVARYVPFRWEVRCWWMHDWIGERRPLTQLHAVTPHPSSRSQKEFATSQALFKKLQVSMASGK